MNFSRRISSGPTTTEKSITPNTKDLHLISAFHHLFDHTHFALTDFIFVRDFRTEIRMEVVTGE